MQIISIPTFIFDVLAIAGTQFNFVSANSLTDGTVIGVQTLLTSGLNIPYKSCKFSQSNHILFFIIYN